MENFRGICTENVLKIHWKWDPENILKLPVKNWYSVPERMVNVLNFTENAQKTAWISRKYTESGSEFTQKLYWNYTEIILKILHGNYTEITPEYVWNYTEIVQNASGIHPEYIKDAILCDFYYYVCKIYASYTKLISH